LTKTTLHWAIEEVERALDRGDVVLARRYMSKIRERFFCMFCGEPILLDQDDVEDYYKGRAHTACLAERGKR
jgi:hypothetical protein